MGCPRNIPRISQGCLHGISPRDVIGDMPWGYIWGYALGIYLGISLGDPLFVGWVPPCANLHVFFHCVVQKGFSSAFKGSHFKVAPGAIISVLLSKIEPINPAKSPLLVCNISITMSVKGKL